jgi:hypothetical protein
MSTIKEAIEDLFNNPQLSADEAIDRHFGPDFRQRTNGSWDDRPAFFARMVDFREIVKHATITVLDELVDGERYAERHIVDLLKHDGDRIRLEVYIFARRDPAGRFTRIEETTLILDNPQETP